MSYNLAIAFGFSIAIAAIAALIRFKKISPVYRPFIFCLWIGLINELLGYFMVRYHHSNAVNNNIYVLLESLFFTWQFKRWGFFKRRSILFAGLISLFITIWLAEVFLLKRIWLTASYFRLIYSFGIVFMSLHIINEELVREKRNILKSATFLICLGFLFYYTFKVIVGAFWFYGFHGSLEVRKSLFIIMIYINFFVNLIYGIAVLCMKNYRYTLL